MGEFSTSHLIILGLIVLILFGSNKLPVFGQSLGRALKGFKEGLRDGESDEKNVQQLNHSEKENLMAQKVEDKDKDKNKV